MKVKKFRKRPVVIEAVQFTRKNGAENHAVGQWG